VSLQVVMIDGQGKASAPVPVFGLQAFGYGTAPSGAWVGDGFLLAREQEAPSKGGNNNIAIARIEKDGKVTSRKWLDDDAGIDSTLVWDGSAAHVWARHFQQKGDETCTTPLDRTGHETAKPTCTPDPVHNMLMGAAAATKGTYLFLQNRAYAGPWGQEVTVVHVGDDGKLAQVAAIGSRGLVATQANRAPEGAAWRTVGDALVVGWLAPSARRAEPTSLWLARIGGP
jgi:hypothetical protein